MLLNLRRVLTTEGQCLLTAYSPHNCGHPTAFSRKEEPVPVGTSRPCETKPRQEQVLSLWDLIEELRLCHRPTFQLHKALTVFIDQFAFIAFQSLKAKNRQPLGNCHLCEWEVELLKQGRSADGGGSAAASLTFFQGLAVPLQRAGCEQSPVYRRVPKSRFACMCLLLQPVTGSG